MKWSELGWTGQGQALPLHYGAFEYRCKVRAGVILALALLFLFVGSDEREAFQFNVMEHMHLSFRRFGAVDSQSHLIR